MSKMAKNLYYGIFIVAAFQLSSIFGKSQPFKNVCSMKDSECLLREAQSHLKLFVNGIEKSNVDKLDEMSLDEIDINADGVDQELQNVKITGLKDAIITDVSFDNDLNLMRLSFDANLTTTADYKLDGVLFKKPIYGTGKATYYIKNIQVDMLIIYDIVQTKNNRHRLHMKRHRSGFTVKTGVEYEYTNLFNGDKTKSDRAHALLNKNWVIITNVFGELFYSKIFEKIYQSLKAFSKYYYLEDVLCYP